MSKPIYRITEPTLLLDRQRCRDNIRRMAEKAARSSVRLRPHFKTHQSLEIGEWFREYSIDAITVSSVRMAEYFSPRWKDITIAIPFNIHEVERVNAMPGDCAINLCVMDAGTVEKLETRLRRKTGVYIKIDTGYHRTGLQENDPQLGKALAALEASSTLSFRGFLAHAGHSYYARSKDEILAVDDQARGVMGTLKRRYEGRFPGLEISLGDTPCCSVVEDFNGLAEVRPGNYVFYDLTQYLIGSCGLDDIAVAMACPVIAKHAERLIIHGGAAHFSKDSLAGDLGKPEFGWVVEATEYGWGDPVEGLKLTALSQEHGTITGPEHALESYSVGDFVYVLPVHSCMTANAMKRYLTLDGELIRHLEAG